MSTIKGFRKSHLNDDLFIQILNGIEKNATLISWEELTITDKIGVMSDIMQNVNEDDRVCGINQFKLKYKVSESLEVHVKDVIIKSKGKTCEIIDSMVKLIPKSEVKFSIMVEEFISNSELSNAEYIDLACSEIDIKNINAIRPDIYWQWIDPDLDIFVFAMEYLHPNEISHFECLNEVELWKENDLLTALDGLALFHAEFYEQVDKIPASLKQCIGRSYKDKLGSAQPFLKSCVDRNFQSSVWSEEAKDIGYKILHNLPEICDIIDSAPKTWIHNDANLANMCLRKKITLKEGKHRFCLYDWEICMTGPPQHDVAFFLLCSQPTNIDFEKWDYFIEKYYVFLKKYLLKRKGCVSNVSSCPDVNVDISSNKDDEVKSFIDFRKVFDMCACQSFIYRFNWASAVIIPAINAPFMARKK